MSVRLRIRIKEGVESGLCGSCRWALIREDDRGCADIRCDITHPPLPVHRPLIRCTQHEAIGSQSKHEMEQIAWILNVRAGKVLGFRPPKKEDER